jgi:hypothetical protein
MHNQTPLGAERPDKFLTYSLRIPSASAILTITGNITEKDRKKGQVLDTLKVERDRGWNSILTLCVLLLFCLHFCTV